MLSIYVIAMLVGGTLILLSAFTGSEHDAHGELDAHADVDVVAAAGDMALDLHHAGELTGEALPFLSLRFWTYFTGFFGLTGVLLTYLADAGPILTPVVAVITGALAGVLVFRAAQFLKRTQINSGVAPQDMIGAEGKVLLTVRADEPGKIRCELKGEMLDLLAVSAEETPIEIGASVIVVAFANNQATIIRHAPLAAESPLGGV